MLSDEHREDMHYAGVHTRCRYAPPRSGDGWKKCHLAGKVERFHSHDFDGPLYDACGCAEYAA